MICFNDIDSVNISFPTVVAIGKFDGMHLGHQKLMNEVVRIKNEHAGNYKTVAFMITHDSDDELLSTQERFKRLESLGIDYVVNCKFTDEVRTMSAEDFLTKILIEKLGAKYIVAGPDVRFGYMGAGDEKFIRSAEKDFDFKLVIIDKKCYKGSEISSTRIKKCILDGDNDDAKAMLG